MVVCQARPKAAASAAATAAPVTDPIAAPARGRDLSPAEDPEQRDRRDASTSYGGDNGSDDGGRHGHDPSAAGGARHTVRVVRGQRPGARQLPDSLRAGVGMAGVPVDGPNRTVRMRRVPRYQQLQQQQQQQQQQNPQQQQQQAPPGEDAGGFTVIDWDALDWEADVQLREEEMERAKQVHALVS